MAVAMSQDERPQTVSVIIPTYNRAKFVVRAVESALSQVGAPEIIVIDDGSTDDTEYVLSRFLDRITYVKQVHLGVVAARNHGLELARGSLIAFLDSDDFWFPGKLALQLRCFEIRPDMVLNCTDSISVADDGRVLCEKFLNTYPGYRYLNEGRHFSEIKRLAIQTNGWVNTTEAFLKVGDLSSAMFMGNFILTPTVLFKREVLFESGMFDPAMNQAGEDYDFFWRISEHGPIGLLDLPTVAVRREGDDHLASARDRMALSNLKTVKKYLQRNPDGPNLDQCFKSRRITESYAWVGVTKFDKGDIATSRMYLLRAIIGGVDQVRVYIYFIFSLVPMQMVSFISKSRRDMKMSKERGRPDRSKRFVHPAWKEPGPWTKNAPVSIEFLEAEKRKRHRTQV